MLYPLKEPANSAEALQTLFTEYRPAIWVGPLNAAMPDDSGNAIDQDGFASFPVAGDGSQGNKTPAEVTCAGVSAGSAHPREAWTWLDFLSRYRCTQVAINPLVELPALRSIVEETAYFQALPQEVGSAVRFILEHARYGSRYPEAFTAVQEALQYALTNDIPTLAALEMIPAGTVTMSGQTESNQIQVNTPPPPPAGGTTVIQYYGLGGNYVQKLEALAETFYENHPDIQVRIAADLEGISPAPGSEWQKIALARLFIRDTDLLILDEPTAALDAQAEYEVYNRFVELVAGKTSLLISHRFSTVRRADFIAVLDGGRITEYGTREELIALGGTYTRLYSMQAERYL
jgi:hypothetical protein